MEREKNSDSRLDRRSLLQYTGAAASALGFGSFATSSALGSNKDQNKQMSDKKFKALIETGQQIQKHRGVEAREKFLRNNGVVVSSVTKEFSGFYKGSSGEENNISTDNLDCVTGRDCDSDLRATVSISRAQTSYTYNVEIAVSHRYKKYEPFGITSWDGGIDPLDGTGFVWGSDEWNIYDDDYIDNSISTTEHIDWNDGSFQDSDIYDKGQIGYEVHDQAWSLDQENTGTEASNATYEWSDTQSASVFLTLDSEGSSSSEIYAEYIHTWGEKASLDSVGFSAPTGITLNFSGGTPSEEGTQTEEDGSNLLKVTEGDTFVY